MKLQYKVLPENKIKLGVLLESKETEVRIKSVSANSNAERSGLKDGDILLTMDGTDLADIEDLVDRLQAKNIGDRAEFRVKRGLREMTLQVELLETALPENQTLRIPHLSFSCL